MLNKTTIIDHHRTTQNGHNIHLWNDRTHVAHPSFASILAVTSLSILCAFAESSNVVAERAETNGISAPMTVQWLTYAALLKRRVEMAVAAESSQNLREAMDTDARRIGVQW